VWGILMGRCVGCKRFKKFFPGWYNAPVHEGSDVADKKKVRKKNPAAVLLGRMGSDARAARMTKEEISEANRKAANARWHPETKQETK
jgi:hypothetical protein